MLDLTFQSDYNDSNAVYYRLNEDINKLKISRRLFGKLWHPEFFMPRDDSQPRRDSPTVINNGTSCLHKIQPMRSQITFIQGSNTTSIPWTWCTKIRDGGKFLWRYISFQIHANKQHLSIGFRRWILFPKSLMRICLSTSLSRHFREHLLIRIGPNKHHHNFDRKKSKTVTS